MNKINSKSDSNSNLYTHDDSLLDGNNIIYLESLYESYLREPESIPSSWQSYFSNLGHVDSKTEAIHSDIRAHFKRLALENRQLPYRQQENKVEQCWIEIKNIKQVKVLQLINSYRFSGHKKAMTNPLNEVSIKSPERAEIPELTLQYHDLDESDLSTKFITGSLFAKDERPLNKIIQQLEHSYCEVIGAQYMYLSSVEEKR